MNHDRYWVSGRAVVEPVRIAVEAAERAVLMGVEEAPYDLWIDTEIAPPPRELAEALTEMNVRFDMAESTNDGAWIRLHNCSGEPLNLPLWLRRKYR